MDPSLHAVWVTIFECLDIFGIVAPHLGQIQVSRSLCEGQG